MKRPSRRQVLIAGGLAAAGAGVAGLAYWSSGPDWALTTAERDHRRAIAALTRERRTLEAASRVKIPLRPIAAVLEEAERFLAEAIEALGMDGAVDGAGPGGGRGARSARPVSPTEWPEVGSAAIRVTLSWWAYDGLVRLVEAVLARFPAALSELTLTAETAAMTWAFYGQASTQHAGAKEGAS
jgi:hypothetical protein